MVHTKNSSNQNSIDMKFSILSIFILFSNTNHVSTQKKPYPRWEKVPRYDGPCPDLKGTAKWDPKIYTSQNWWNSVASPSFWNFPGSSCISATYELTGEISSSGGVYFSILNQAILPEQKQEKYGSQYGIARGLAVENTNYNGTAEMLFMDAPPDPNGDNYKILDTDNHSYAYIWTGTHGPDSCQPVLWLLFSDRNISKKDLAGHVQNAIEIIRIQSNWKWIYDFEDTLEYWPTVNCPDVPNSPYNN